MTTKELIEVAMDARLKAYSPYSRFQVGAALLSTEGGVFVGCNVENVSFGLTNCAERVAVGSAIVHGAKEFELLAVVTDSSEPVVPCGACRQVLAEFAPNLRIVSSTLNGNRAEYELGKLLPTPRRGILG